MMTDCGLETTLLTLGLLFAVLSSGCGGGDPTGRDESDLDALRALPYLDYSPRKAGDLHGVVVFDRERSHPGLNLSSYRHLCRAELYDDRGRVLRSWQHAPCRTWSNAEILPMGDLFVPMVGSVAGADTLEDVDSDSRVKGRFLLRLDFDGNVVWATKLAVHHDVDLTPRGQIMALTMNRRTIVSGDEEIRIRDNSIVLLSLDGEVMDGLSLYDLFAQDPERFPLLPIRAKAGRLVDLFHANSIQWIDLEPLRGQHPIYDAGNVLVSIRHQNVVVIVNWDERSACPTAIR